MNRIYKTTFTKEYIDLSKIIAVEKTVDRTCHYEFNVIVDTLEFPVVMKRNSESGEVSYDTSSGHFHAIKGEYKDNFEKERQDLIDAWTEYVNKSTN